MANCYFRQNKKSEEALYWQKATAEAQGLQDTSKRDDYLIIINYDKGNNCTSERKYEEGIQHYQDALTILGYPKKQKDTHYLPLLLRTLSRAMARSGRGEEALFYLDESLRITAKTDNKQPNDKGALSDTSSTLTAYNRVRVMHYRALALLAKWKQNPQKEILDEAAVTIEQAIRFSDRYGQQFLKNRSESFTWLKENRNLHWLAIEIAWQQYYSQKDPGKLERAFQLADRSKVKILSHSIKDAAAKQFAGLPPEVLEKETQLRTDISFYEISAFEAKSENSNSVKARSIDSLLLMLKREQEAFISNLEQRYPHYYNHCYTTPAVSSADIQRALKPNALFIEYMLDHFNRQVYIFTIDRHSGLKVKVAPFDSAVNEQVRELNQLASSIFLVRKDKKARFIELSHALYQQFLKPVEALLNGKNELIVVSEGSLNYLPFELLLKKPTDATFQNLRYLLHDFEVKYQYSGALFLRNAANITSVTGNQAQSADVSDRSLLAFAPVFDNNNTTDKSSEALALRNRNAIDTTLRATFVDGEFVPLPYSEQEARTIVQLFGDPKAKVLLYQDADEATLKAELQKKRRIAHIATHSFANLEQPKFSGIACAQPTDSTDREDGILYVSEIYNLIIPADLVVLSSCESGLGKLASSEGLLGLNHAFAYAGVPNIVYSLWKVNDKAGSELMIEFYKQILTGKSYSAALRAAKLKMLEKPTTASPNFWSGFLLMGR